MNRTFWKGKNVLVTGGDGMVGSHMVEELLSFDSNVIVPFIELDPNSYFLSKGFDKKVIMVPCDIKDKQKVHHIVSRYEVDIIIHLAAQPIVYTAFVNPVETMETNINGTINVLEAARHCTRVKAIVVASSDKAYGASEILPYDESVPLKGEHPYDTSKSCADLISQMYAKVYDVPVTITRFANIFGPGDLNLNRIIPGAILSIIRKEPLEIRSSGKMIREYLYVKDVVQGYMLLAEKIDQTKGKAYNFSSGVQFDVIGVVEEISKVLETKPDYKILNREDTKHEIEKQYLSFEKVKKEVGWTPKYSFEDSIKETFDWYNFIFNK